MFVAFLKNIFHFFRFQFLKSDFFLNDLISHIRYNDSLEFYSNNILNHSRNTKIANMLHLTVY